MTTKIAELTDRVKVAETGEIAEGSVKTVIVGGKQIAVFRIKNQYFAISNNCLHRGGPLSEGEVKNYEVACPWHGWKYSILDGSFALIPTLRVNTYHVEESSEGIFVEIKTA